MKQNKTKLHAQGFRHAQASHLADGMVLDIASAQAFAPVEDFAVRPRVMANFANPLTGKAMNAETGVIQAIVIVPAKLLNGAVVLDNGTGMAAGEYFGKHTRRS